MTQDIQHTFNAVSEKYDSQRKKLIPCFNDFYAMSLKLSEEVVDINNILDIGAGTGLLTAFYTEKYPHAKIDLVDISEEMLLKARERFEGNENIQFILQDFAALESELSKYDLVISALAIHHLTDEQKKELYRKIYTWIKPGGMFINADQILGASEFSERIFTTTWKKMVKDQKGLTDEEKLSAFERIKLDKMSGLEIQLQWLKEAGFSEAENFYQYHNFVVFAAIK